VPGPRRTGPGKARYPGLADSDTGSIVWRHRGGPSPQAKNAVNRFSSALKSLLANRHLLVPAQRQRLIRALALAQEELASDAEPAELRPSAAGSKTRDPQLVI
jgi:hypothetical protein